MAKVYRRIWKLLGIYDWSTPAGCCPLCGYVAVTTREHHCNVAGGWVTWED